MQRKVGVGLSGPKKSAKSLGARRQRRAMDLAGQSDFVQAIEKDYSLEHLVPVSGRPTLRQYCSGIWQRRHFIWWESKSKVATENISNRLGAFWLILRPGLDAAFYWIIFGFILDMGDRMHNYVAFVIIGVFMFQLTSAAISNGVNIIRSSRSVIRAFHFPRASLPLGSLVHDVLQRIPAMLTMLVIIMAIPPHALPSLSWLLLPAALVVHVTLNAGLYFIFGRLGHMLPDLSKAMSFVTRLLLYGSAVIFPIASRLEGHPTLLRLVELNPVYQILTMYRSILIDGVNPSAETWLTVGAWAIALSLFGFIFFWLGEETYTREQQ